MGLNIKNDEAHRLAQELAALTGESMTAAVTAAVRERLDRVRRERGVTLTDRLLKIGRECAARLKEPIRSVDHAALLYDERGLPR
jgi:antitoxin VapB